MQTHQNQSEPSPLQAALDARKRTAKTVQIPFHSDGAGDGTVAIRVPVLRQEVWARFEAAKWIQSNAAGVPAEIASQVDLASVWLVYDCFMQPKERRPGYTETAFLTPDRMLSTLTADDLGKCVEELNDARAIFAGGAKWDEDEAEEYAKALSLLDDDGAAELLEHKPKAWLVKLAKYLADR